MENIELSSDSNWASAWLVMTNPQSSEVIPSELTPALAYWDGIQWNAVYPFDDDWVAMLASAPPDIQEDPTIATWLALNIPQPDYQLLTAIGGYFLPWEGGRTVYLSRSIAHDRTITSGNAHYSYDFYVPQTMFNIHAAKAGTVWLYKDSVANNDHNAVNYLVLQDTSTNPISSPACWTSNNRRMGVARPARTRLYPAEVHTAANAAEAESALERGLQPDGMILDVMMSGKGEGMIFARKIRKNPSHKHIPILMLTGMSEATGYRPIREDARDPLFLPVDIYLEKPVPPETRLKIIERMLADRKAGLRDPALVFDRRRTGHRPYLRP